MYMILEEIREAKGIGKYIKHIAVLLLLLTGLVTYSYINSTIDHKIMQLQQQKSELVAENFRLKQDIAALSSPKRVADIARNKLQMKNVSYSQVRFIEKQ